MAADDRTRRLVLVRAGNLAIRLDPSLREAYRARFGRRAPRVRDQGETVTIEYPRGLLGTVTRREPSTVTLDASPLWRIEARGPLREVTMDLAAGLLGGFEAQGGATSVTMSLPPPSGRVVLRVAGGLSEVTINRPAGVEVGLRVTGGVSNLRLDDQAFRAVGGRAVLRSPGFDGASDRYEIEVLRGARALTVDAVAPTRADRGRTGRALATVLFTDIVASTERARQVGDARWREILDRHEETAVTLVREAGGELVKTTGDGILATFERPGPAIAAAASFRHELGELGIEIRAGLHTGEIEYRGGDVGGIAVHIAARVMATASSGEILVSRTVRDLVAGAEIELEDRGNHALRGVGDWQLFAVI